VLIEIANLCLGLLSNIRYFVTSLPFTQQWSDSAGQGQLSREQLGTGSDAEEEREDGVEADGPAENA